MVSYYRAFAPKSEAVNCWDNRATLKLCVIFSVIYKYVPKVKHVMHRLSGGLRGGKGGANAPPFGGE